MAVPKVLLVEDDAPVRAFIQATLEQEGFQVETFESAEALTAFAGPDEPECFVFAYRLPGIDGLSLLQALRSLGVKAPAIILASNPGWEIRGRAAALGTALVAKPVIGDELVVAIRMSVSPATDRELKTCAAPLTHRLGQQENHTCVLQ